MEQRWERTQPGLGGQTQELHGVMGRAMSGAGLCSGSPEQGIAVLYRATLCAVPGGAVGSRSGGSAAGAVPRSQRRGVIQP